MGKHFPLLTKEVKLISVRMVFPSELGPGSEPEDPVTSSYSAMRAARFVKQLGAGVVRVVHRCDAALEEETLDLSDCQLVQVPEAVFHLMRNTELSLVSLSFNLLSRLPPRLCTSFSTLLELDISHNRLSSLPEGLEHLVQLESLDMSSNSFLELPPVLARLPSLSKLVARKNFVSSLEVEGVLACPSLEHLNVEENPLRKEVYEELETITTIRVILSPREMEEWEDLSC